MTVKVFIDGAAGTTGIEIHERLAGRRDIELVTLADDRRKDAGARAEALNAADAVILCLPDDAAREAVSLIDNATTRVIDASTAHRTDPTWIYGFAEVAPGRREALASATRVSNPGCYPTGFLALVAPLVRAGLLPADWPYTVNAVSGYSGGGKAMIARFEADPDIAWRGYGLNGGHKHVPEMQLQAGLTHPPLFAPAVGDFAQGMLVEVPLQLWALPKPPSVADLREAIAAAYAGERFVEVADAEETAATNQLAPEGLNDTNRLRLYVFGDDRAGQARLVALLDNLGKGASGAAVQNLNIMLGLDEAAGLE